ncbi:MAG: hypothetical protein V8T62_11030 [Oscillospiraceae bacterium]
MVETMNAALLGCQPSGIRRFTALAKAEPGCLFLTIGEPDFSTPEPIKEATKTALDQNLTHYPPGAGSCICGRESPGLSRSKTACPILRKKFLLSMEPLKGSILRCAEF